MVLTKVIVLDGSQALALARLSLDHSREHFTAALLVLVEKLLAAATLDPPLATLVGQLESQLLGVGTVGNPAAFRCTGFFPVRFDSRLAAVEFALVVDDC